MRVQYLILILFSCYSLENCFAYPSDETEPESEHGEAGKLISQDGNGLCTFEITKYERKNVVSQYFEMVTFIGRCRGSYFRRCVNEKSIPKTRLEERIEPTKMHQQKCCTGYRPTINSSNICVPVCDPDCEFGTCTAPNTCACQEGYIKHETEANICVPQCHGCEYGVCLEPNLCQCYPNYDWDMEHLECIPICSGNCHNGKCVGPEQCVCDPGYIQSDNVCIPHCMNPCMNGVCISPEVCVCFDGYGFVNDTNYMCEPICEIECGTNSKCVEPNTCECEDGYIPHDDNKPHECICGKYCAEIDGKCHCLDAKQRVSVKDFDNTTLCSKNNCANGYCKTPMQCECFEGFEKDEHSNICAPINETCIDDPTLCGTIEVSNCDCINGICSSNGECICLNGFKMVADHNDRCEPHCSKECVNGVCVDPDTCLCENEIDYHIGYNETEWNICHPICDRDTDDTNGCYNGTCIAPGVCECFDGFELDSNANFTCKLIQIGAHSSTDMRFVCISIIVLVVILSGVTYLLHIVRSKKLLSKSFYDDQRRPIANGISTEDL